MTDGDEVGLDRSGGGPARGYSWPPFEVGNEVRLEHGAHSAKRVQPLADRLAADLRVAAPWTASPAFAGTVASWAWAEGQALLLRRWLDEHEMLDAEGEERSAARLLDRVEGRLAKLRDQLGLNPTALSKLLATSAEVAKLTGDEESIEAVAAEGARMLAARMAQVAGEAMTAGALAPHLAEEATDARS